LWTRFVWWETGSRRNLLLHLYAKWQDDDVFPLMRLLLPQLDRERQTYGVKETVIARTYVDILGLAPGGKDAQRVINWRRPTDQGQAGDFATMVFLTVNTRVRSQPTLSIYGVNLLLDRLNTAQDKEERNAVFNKVCPAVVCSHACSDLFVVVVCSSSLFGR
jgi:DNA ligase 4